ncbi:MAG: Sensor histidine kinase RcsC [Chlamydiia bacterium]|nr:Sensor histidine kinase RcsC [Chlamydiia bacterium]MCH9614965.1 Sensor histidine kinase RcsC [Chlamydiia bacterium]MCH9629985.1 Sensor histidine kinase RcsC [Chlamydiia bacterium]
MKTKKQLIAFPLVLAYLVLLLGLVVVLGWYTKTLEVIQVFNGFVPMQFNTALGFIAIGLSLILYSYGKKGAALVVGCIPFLLGGLTIFEYLFKQDLGIDEFFVRHYITTSSSSPGRMAPFTAIAFMLISHGILALNCFKSSLNKIWLSGAFASLAFAIGFVSLLGYLFDIQAAYGWLNLTHMAIHTTIGFILSSTSLYFLVVKGIGKHVLRISLVFSALMTIFLTEILLWEPLRTLSNAKIIGVFSPEQFRISLISVFLILLLGIAIYLYREILRISINLDRSRIHAEEDAAGKEILLRHISHEIRNPLHAALGLLGLIKENPKGDNQESFDRVYSSCHHILRVIENLLSITRRERGKLELAERPFDFEDWTKSVHSICEVISSHYNLDFHFDSKGNVTQQLVGDSTKLSQIVFNLCDNALKYTSAGEINVHIEIEQQQNTALLTIRVIDTGIGIPIDKQKKVFEFFGRSANEHHLMGAGYGLAICKTYTNMMQGKIFFVSVVGKGSTFTVQIPLSISQENAA